MILFQVPFLLSSVGSYIHGRTHRQSLSVSFSMQRRAVSREQKWIEKPNAYNTSSSSAAMQGVSVEAVTNGIDALRIAENNGEFSVPVQGQKDFCEPKTYGTISGAEQWKLKENLDISWQVKFKGMQVVQHQVKQIMLF